MDETTTPRVGFQLYNKAKSIPGTTKDIREINVIETTTAVRTRSIKKESLGNKISLKSQLKTASILLENTRSLLTSRNRSWVGSEITVIINPAPTILPILARLISKRWLQTESKLL